MATTGKPSREMLSARIDVAAGRIADAPPPIPVAFQDGVYPSWSHDGRHLACAVGTPGGPRARLAIFTAATEQTRTMGIPGEVVAGLRWSPDGRWLTYAALLPGSIVKVFRTDLQTGDTSEVPGTSGVMEGNLTADGKRVYYRGKAGALARDLATGNDTVVVEGTVVKTALSPDEKWLAVHQRSSESNTHTLGLAPTAGGAVKPLFQAPAGSFLFLYLNWSVDSLRLFVIEGKSGGDRHYILWSIPVDGRPPTTIDLGAIAPGSGFSVHPDGKTVVLTNSKSEPREVWAIENFLPVSKPASKPGPVK